MDFIRPFPVVAAVLLAIVSAACGTGASQDVADTPTGTASPAPSAATAPSAEPVVSGAASSQASERSSDAPDEGATDEGASDEGGGEATGAASEAADAPEEPSGDPTPSEEPSADPAPPPDEPAREPAAHAVDIVDFGFEPADLAIGAGDSVTWTHVGEVNHTVTFSSGGDSGSMSPGDTYRQSFESVGTFTYRCLFHSQMQGSITVG